MSAERAAHLVLTHTNGDQCIWIEGGRYWFIPLDAGGEGYPCPHWHPMDSEAHDA